MNPFRAAWTNLMQGEFLQTAVTDWLQTNGWITVAQDDGVSLTELGQCVLCALRDAQTEPPADRVILFREDAPFGYAEFLSRLASYPNFMLVDPYFSDLAHLEDLLTRTLCSRILVSTGLKKAQKDGLVVALRSIPADKLDIRAARDLHDRFVIPEGGDAASLGTSLTGLGKHFSVMCVHGAPFSDTIRNWHRAKWDEAKSLRE